MPAAGTASTAVGVKRRQEERIEGGRQEGRKEGGMDGLNEGRKEGHV